MSNPTETQIGAGDVSGAGLFGLFLLAAAVFSGPAIAQGQSPGDASIRLEYQYILTDRFYDDVWTYDAWTTESHVVMLSGDYAFSERWSAYASLPYVQKKFNCLVPVWCDPHNPNDPYWVDFVPPDKRFIDDGDYHGGLQDLSFGFVYRALEGPLTISPYIGYGFPTNDYPFFAKAAIGMNLWNLPVGATFSYVPYFSDWHFRGNLAYVFSEKPLDINVDFWLANLSAGYWFSQRLSVNVFLSAKWILDGLEMPWDFTDDPFYGNYPGDFDTREWWQHDRLIGHRNVNLGVGVDYFLGESSKLSGSYYTGIHAEQSSEVDYAFTLAYTRYFDGD